MTHSLLPFTLLLALTALGSPLAHAQEGTAKVDWERVDHGPGRSTLVRAVRLPNGNVACIGNRDGGTGRELAAIGLDPAGNLLWTTLIPNPYGNGTAFPRRAMLNVYGEIVIAAEITGGATTYDYHFVVLDQSGYLLNDRVVDNFDWDLVSGLDAGPAGNLVFCGYGIAPGQYAAAKMDRSLNTLWKVDLGNPGPDRQYATGVQITPNGDVLVSGIVSDGSNQDVRLDRLAPDGSLVYSKDFGDPVYADYDPIVHAGSNGGTYFAFRKAAFDPPAEARLYRLDQTGTVQWGMVDPDLAWTHIRELPGDEFIVCGPGPFPLGAVRTFRRFDSFGATLGTRTWLLPEYQHNWITSATVDGDGVIYAAGHATVNGGTAPDWLVHALTIEGKSVYQWSMSAGDDSYDFPGEVVALGDGAILVCGEIGGISDDDAVALRLQAELTLPPDTVTLHRGVLVSGAPAALEALDGLRYLVRNDDVATGERVPMVSVETAATVPADYPTGSLGLVLTARTDVDALVGSVSLWNFATGTWGATRDLALTPTDATFQVQGNSADHVDPITGRVRARIRAERPGAQAAGPWRLEIDQAVWRITP